MNRTYLYEKEKIKTKLVMMRERLQEMYGFRYPIQRRVMEDRLAFLESDFNLYDYKINPYHIQPGLLLDVDITSIKRKKATLDGMANVLNEFLHGVSKGFQDAAFAAFSRRRSTVRDDIAMSFSTDVAEDEKVAAGQAYIDMLNEEASSGAEEGTVVEESSDTESDVSGGGAKKPSGRRSRKKRDTDSGLKSL